MGKRKPKSAWGKIWQFIWYDDSPASWLVNIVIAFLLVRFIVYPLLGALLGTGLPVVAVVSESMDHDYIKDKCSDFWELCGDISADKQTKYSKSDYWNQCGEWYDKRGISEEIFTQFPMEKGFSKGDIIVLAGKEPENIAVGDVIVFQSQKQYPIIHRVIDIKEESGKYTFATKGDHNGAQIIDPFLDETKIPEERVLGVAKAKIPFLGWVKIIVVNILGKGRTCP